MSADLTGLRVVFAGTPAFALPSLKAIVAANAELAWVYTAPDAIAGRGQRLRPSCVKRFALEQGIACEQPKKLGEAQASALKEANIDVLVVVAYGKIVPQSVLDAPRFGGINVHGSVLPRWRGAAPIQRAILAGDDTFGVSIMQMDAGLDTGPVYTSMSIAGGDDSAGVLSERLALIGGTSLVDVLSRLSCSVPTAQPATGSCYAAKIQKQEACLDWRLSAVQLTLCVRAFNPWPMAFCFISGIRVRVLTAQIVDASVLSVSVGTITSVCDAGIDIACAEGVLRLCLLQLPGSTPQPAAKVAKERGWSVGTLCYAEGSSC